MWRCLGGGRWRGAVLAGLLALAAPTAAAEQGQALARQLDELRALGGGQDAFRLGLDHLAELSGDSVFDFSFGLAALEAGQYDHAALAFSRILHSHPRNDRARLELARAHFLGGNDAAARQQFEAVLANDPPPNVRARIEQFLSRIEARRAANRPRLVGFLGARGGYDDNVSTVTDRTLTLIFPGGSAQLTADRLEDGFVEIGGGADYLHPLSKNTGLFAGVGYSDRHYFEQSAFDRRSLDLRAGAMFLNDWGRWRLPLQLQWMQLDDEDYRRLISFGLEWARPLSGRTEIGAFTQLGTVRYPDLPLFDVDTLLLGGIVSHRLGDAGTQLTAIAFAGRDRARDDDGEHNSRRFAGLRLSLNLPLTGTHALNAVAAYQRANHDADNPAYQARREDDLYQVGLAWLWRPLPRWELKTGVDYYHNHSGLGLYDHDRTQAGVGLRYVWE